MREYEAFDVEWEEEQKVMSENRYEIATNRDEECKHPYWFDMRAIKVKPSKFGVVVVMRCMNCLHEVEVPFINHEMAVSA